MKLRTVFETAQAENRYIIYLKDAPEQPIFCGSFSDADSYDKLRDHLSSEAADKGMSGTYHLVELERSAA